MSDFALRAHLKDSSLGLLFKNAGKLFHNIDVGHFEGTARRV